MRYGWLILLLLPLGIKAQLWFKTDSAGVENPFYYRYSKGKNVFTRPIFSVRNEKQKQYLTVNPWFDLKFSQDENNNYLKNGRGILVEGQHGNFRYFSGLQEVQEEAFKYQKDAASTSLALRGHNRTKITKDGIYDFADFMAGLQYQGQSMRYSVGWHPVKVGSGIRPMLVSHLNTGFFNYQVGFTSKNKKLVLAHANGFLFGNQRLQSKSNSEAGIRRSQLNWLNLEYTISENLHLVLHTDATTKLYTDSSEQIRPKIQNYLPLPFAMVKNGSRRLGGELFYLASFGKLYVGAINTGVFYGGFSAKKSITDKLEAQISSQATKHDAYPENFNQFGNNFTTAYADVDFDVLTHLSINYQNVRLESSFNYFDSNSSTGLNIFASLGYCIHPTSELQVYAFAEQRQFPNQEQYFGIGLRNNLGINRNTY